MRLQRENALCDCEIVENYKYIILSFVFQMLTSMSQLIKLALFNSATDPKEVYQLFPGIFSLFTFL